MPTFQVHTTTTIREVYQVEADSAEQAIKKIALGDWFAGPDKTEIISVEPDWAERT